MQNFTKFVFVMMVGFLGSAGVVYAADMGSITVVSPKDGAMIPAGSPAKLVYNVKLGPEGNHLHVYVDDQKPIIDRDVTGCPCSVELPALSAGKHMVVIKEARADHSLTGVMTSTAVTAK